jgi:membrane protein implicated in regulation of membrane protease activity
MTEQGEAAVEITLLWLWLGFVVVAGLAAWIVRLWRRRRRRPSASPAPRPTHTAALRHPQAPAAKKVQVHGTQRKKKRSESR